MRWAELDAKVHSRSASAVLATAPSAPPSSAELAMKVQRAHTGAPAE